MNKIVLQIVVLSMICGSVFAENGKQPQWQEYPSVIMEDSLSVPVNVSLVDEELSWIFSRVDTVSPPVPNFAGSFRIVEVPCGSMCTAIIVINCKTGTIYKAPFSVELGCTYKTESSLFVENPIENIRKLYDDTSAPDWAKPQYYTWDGKNFLLVK